MLPAVAGFPRLRLVAPLRAQSHKWRAAFAVPFVGVAFLVATNEWVSWHQAISDRFASDVREYEAIAASAPGLTDHELVSVHASRFLLHYLTGLIANVTGVPLHSVYRLLMLGLLIAVVAIVSHILRHRGLGPMWAALCMGCLLADPYLFRFLLIAPGMLQDAAFVASTAVVILGLVDHRLSLLVAGLVFAVISRADGALPLVPAVMLYLVLAWPWRGASPSRRRFLIGLAVVLPLATYAGVEWAATLFPNRTPMPTSTVLTDLVRLPSTSGTLLVHFARVCLGITLPLALLISSGLSARRAQRLRSLPKEVWASLAIAAVIALQPLVLSPAFTQGSEPRLSSLAAVPLIVAGGFMLEALSADGSPPAFRQRDSVLLFTVVMLGSLSHRFSVIGPATAGQFAVLQAACAAVLGFVILRRCRPPLRGAVRGLDRQRDPVTVKMK